MTIPVATALIGGNHSASYASTTLPKSITLTGSASGGTITDYEWSILPLDANNPGGYPSSSGLASGTHGDFTDGKSTVQNPSITLDVVGGYNFSLRAKNSENNWSLPSSAYYKSAWYETYKW